MRAICSTFILCLALIVPSAAGAQTATDDVYDPIDQRTEQRAEAKGDLPLTGGEVGLVVLAGGAILGTGLAIRRASQT